MTNLNLQGLWAWMLEQMVGWMVEAVVLYAVGRFWKGVVQGGAAWITEKLMVVYVRIVVLRNTLEERKDAVLLALRRWMVLQQERGGRSLRVLRYHLKGRLAGPFGDRSVERSMQWAGIG